MSYKRFLILCAGSVIQYFNYAIFSFCAFDIAKNFMPGNVDKHKILNLFAALIITVLARPLGSVFFGTIGDRIGRKYALILSGIVGSLGAIIVPFISTYNEIGIIASILLIFSRMIFLSGLSGEIDGIRIYISENLSNKTQNFGNGLVTLFTQLGPLTASFILYLTSENSYGWKFCFLLGGVLGLIFSFIRIQIPETVEYMAEKEQPSQYFKVTISQIINGQFLLLCKAAIITGTIGCFYQFYIILMPIYIKLEYNYDLTKYIPCFILLYGIGGALFGYIADKVSPYITIKRILIVIVINLLFLAYSLQENRELLVYIILVGSFFISGFSVPCQILLKQKINVGIRYRMFSLGHSIGSLCISAPTAFLCTKIAIEANSAYIVIYPLFFVAISLAIISSLKKS